MMCVSSQNREEERNEWFATTISDEKNLLTIGGSKITFEPRACAIELFTAVINCDKLERLSL